MDTTTEVSVEEAEIAPVVSKEGGKTVAEISADYTKPQKLSTNESSNLGKSNAVFRPGAINTQSEIIIEEGIDIVDAKSKKELGLKEDYVPYSKPLNISSSAEIDGAVPLTIALEMNEDLSLTNNGKIFIAIYILETKSGPKLGVIPTADIYIKDLIASFDFTTRGTYSKVSFQLAAFEFSGALNKEVESDRNIRPKDNSLEKIGETEDPTKQDTLDEDLAEYPACPQSLDPSKFASTTEICGVKGTLDLSNLKAENILSGQTIAGVSGTLVQENYIACATDGQTSCLTNDSFPAADTNSLTAKVMSGQTVAGVQGSTSNVVSSDCTAANQEGCLATSTYKTMDLSAKDLGGALDISSALFSARVKSSSTFEYWDEQGVRHTNTGDADIVETNVLDNAEIFGITGTAGAPPDCSSISVGGTWILVPGNSDYGTNDFCVMKYEAKCSLADGQTCTASMNTESPNSTASNTPWVSINQQDASTECTSLGKGFHLITNDEWMTIATNVANVASNWSNGTVGDAQLNNGHSDSDPNEACAASSDDSLNVVETDCTNQNSANDDFSERRTHTLSNGKIIWDLAGNVREWTSYFNDKEKPSPNASSWYEYTQPIVGTSTMLLTDLIPQIAIDNSWNQTKLIGRYYPGLDTTGGALHRSGSWNNSGSSGVFNASLNSLPTSTNTSLGFRCAISVP